MQPWKTHHHVNNKRFMFIHWPIHNVVISMHSRQLCTQSYLLHRKKDNTTEGEVVVDNNSASEFLKKDSLELTMGDVLTRDYPFVYAHYRN